MNFAWTIVVMVVVLGLAWRFLGGSMVAAFEGRTRWLTLIVRPVYGVLRTGPYSPELGRLDLRRDELVDIADRQVPGLGHRRSLGVGVSRVVSGSTPLPGSEYIKVLPNEALAMLR
jgi:hypothetical protein